MTLQLQTFFLFSFLLLTLGCSEEHQQQTVTKIVPQLEVQTIQVEKKNVPIWVRYTGRTRASSHQDIRARVQGVLEAIYFQDGAFVKKGEKLFKIQQDEYKAALQSAKAKKLQDQAALALAKANVKRYKPLVLEGLAPRATLEEYEAQLQQLQASLIEDDAHIKQAQIALNYTIITAPVSGKISTHYVDVGNIVGQGKATLLTTIVKTDPLYTYFSPSQSDMLLFQKYKSQKKPYAFIELHSHTHTIRLNGFVDFANNTIDPLTSTITMRANIQNPREQILPGSFVYVHVFVTDKYKFIMIPPEIILNDQLGKYLYTVDKNNTIQRRDIETGYETKYYVSVTKGLNDGDRVVVSALLKIHPGMQIKTKDVTQNRGIDAILAKNKLFFRMR